MRVSRCNRKKNFKIKWVILSFSRDCLIFPFCLYCKDDHDEFDCELTLLHFNLPDDFLIFHYIAFPPLKWLLMHENPKTTEFAKTIFSKEIDLEFYRGSEEWNEREEKVVKPLLKSGFCKMFKKIQVDSDFLHKISIIFDMNSFEITTEDRDVVRGIYPLTGLLSHSCVSNTVLGADRNYMMTVYASVPIKKGEVLYHSYVNQFLVRINSIF